MEASTNISRVALQVNRNVVVASIQVDLTEATLGQFQTELLECVHATGSVGVVFDLSGVATLDTTEFAAIRRIIDMAGVMGAKSVLVGLKPGVGISLAQASHHTVPRVALFLLADAVYDQQPDRLLVSRILRFDYRLAK